MEFENGDCDCGNMEFTIHGIPETGLMIITCSTCKKHVDFLSNNISHFREENENAP